MYIYSYIYIYTYIYIYLYTIHYYNTLLHTHCNANTKYAPKAQQQQHEVAPPMKMQQAQPSVCSVSQCVAV